MPLDFRTLAKDDLDQAWELDQDAFNGDGNHRDAFEQQSEVDRFHGAFEDGRLLATARVIPFGQYFGGRRVPMGGLSSVAVRPDARGRGLALRCCLAALLDMRERGECVSSLFPATTALYRKLGWELAGAYVIRRIPTRSLRQLPAPAAGRVRSARREDVPAIKALYASLAPTIPGFLERGEPQWYYLDALWDEFSVYVSVGAQGEIDGWVAYRQLATPPQGSGFVVQVRDLFATSREAFTSLHALLGSTSTQAETIEYKSSPEDPLLLLLPEQHEAVHGDIRWMLRIVDPAAAIEARGFADGLALGVDFSLSEPERAAALPALSANSGAWHLEVSKGKGHLSRATGDPSLRVGAGAFGSLYSGWAQTATLARTGLLSGGTPAERAALDAAFAGPTPWLPEEF